MSTQAGRKRNHFCPNANCLIYHMQHLMSLPNPKNCAVCNQQCYTACGLCVGSDIMPLLLHFPNNHSKTSDGTGKYLTGKYPAVPHSNPQCLGQTKDETYLEACGDDPSPAVCVNEASCPQWIFEDASQMPLGFFILRFFALHVLHSSSNMPIFRCGAIPFRTIWGYMPFLLTATTCHVSLGETCFSLSRLCLRRSILIHWRGFLLLFSILILVVIIKAMVS